MSRELWVIEHKSGLSANWKATEDAFNNRFDAQEHWNDLSSEPIFSGYFEDSQFRIVRYVPGGDA